MVLKMEKEFGGVLLNHAPVLYISATPFRHSGTLAGPTRTYVCSEKLNDVIYPSIADIADIRQGGIALQ